MKLWDSCALSNECFLNLKPSQFSCHRLVIWQMFGPTEVISLYTQPLTLYNAMESYEIHLHNTAYMHDFLKMIYLINLISSGKQNFNESYNISSHAFHMCRVFSSPYDPHSCECVDVCLDLPSCLITSIQLKLCSFKILLVSGRNYYRLPSLAMQLRAAPGAYYLVMWGPPNFAWQRSIDSCPDKFAEDLCSRQKLLWYLNAFVLT